MRQKLTAFAKNKELHSASAVLILSHDMENDTLCRLAVHIKI